MKNKDKKQKLPKICITCGHCIYIGDGDYICDADEPIVVMEEHCPNDNYCWCNETEWEEEY